MHGLIRDHLEDYLRGGSERKLPWEFEQHLRNCDECRGELALMLEQSQLLHVLAPSHDLSVAPGFYARVLDRIEARQNQSFWNVFLDPAFGRRIVATCVTVIVLLGGYLAFTESRSQEPVNVDAESIMAVEDHPPGLGQDRQRDRDTILVTLATYHE
jgi:hypothetical protein